MGGLNHDFLVIDGEDFDLKKMSFYKSQDQARLDDDFLYHFYSSQLWIEAYNPSKKEPHAGLCLQGVTILPYRTIHKTKAIFQAWRDMISCAPETLRLSCGNVCEWDEEKNEPGEPQPYNPEFSKGALLQELNKLLQFCDEVATEGGRKSILHLGI